MDAEDEDKCKEVVKRMELCRKEEELVDASIGILQSKEHNHFLNKLGNTSEL